MTGENIPLNPRKYKLQKSLKGWYTLTDPKLLSLLLKHSGMNPVKFKRKQRHKYYTFHTIPRKALNKSIVAFFHYKQK